MPQSTKLPVAVLIEDDQMNADSTQILLNMIGIQVVILHRFGSVEEILDHEPSLVILDINLGDLSGKHICQSLKMGNRSKHIPVMMISSHLELSRIAAEASADAFLPKPFEMAQLHATAQLLIGLR